MKKLIVSILFLFLVIFCPSCKKDTDELIVTGKTTVIFKDSIWEDESIVTGSGTVATISSIEKLAGEIAKLADKKTFEAEAGAKIVTPEDVTVDIPANACLGKDNKPCKGKIDVEILYLRTKGDLIANDKPTTSGGKLLVSGGVVYIWASQGKDEVKIATGKPWKIKFQNTIADEGMRYFEGKSEGKFKFDWKLVNNSRDVGVSTWKANDTSSISREAKGYEILTDRFGWINCDKFHSESNLTTKFSVSLTSEFTNRNTSVFMVFKDINSVVKLEGNPSTRDFTIPNGYKGIPIGKNVTVVSTSKFDTYSMMAVQDATITANATVKLVPVRMTNEEMKKKIQGL
jgi:preprotein translocase subunit YajC